MHDAWLTLFDTQRRFDAYRGDTTGELVQELVQELVREEIHAVFGVNQWAEAMDIMPCLTMAG